jgi:hypothetical protein
VGEFTFGNAVKGVSDANVDSDDNDNTVNTNLMMMVMMMVMMMMASAIQPRSLCQATFGLHTGFRIIFWSLKSAPTRPRWAPNFFL